MSYLLHSNFFKVPNSYQSLTIEDIVRILRAEAAVDCDIDFLNLYFYSSNHWGSEEELKEIRDNLTPRTIATMKRLLGDK